MSSIYMVASNTEQFRSRKLKFVDTLAYCMTLNSRYIYEILFCTYGVQNIKKYFIESWNHHLLKNYFSSNESFNVKHIHHLKLFHSNSEMLTSLISLRCAFWYRGFMWIWSNFWILFAYVLLRNGLERVESVTLN